MIPPGHFDQLYANNIDPWDFETSPYERDKYAATLAALPAPRYRSVLEVGCSIGVFTRLLAARADAVLAVDVAEAALVHGREVCAGLDQVRFERLVLPGDWPGGAYDLIIWSEVLYYLGGLPQIEDAARLSRDALLPGGAVVLVNWRGPTDGYCTGEQAADTFIAAAGLPTLHHAREEKYRLDVLGALTNPGNS